MWVIFTIIGNLFQFFGAFLFLVGGEDIFLNTAETLAGLGCYWAWIGSVRFLNHTSKAYTIINTLDRSFTTIGPYIVGTFPIFMGYVFFAVCAFWEVGVYPNTHMGMIAAFAVVNGDSVYSFGSLEYSQNAFFGLLFYFTFVVFFIW